MYVAGLGKNGASCEYVDMIGAKMLQTAAGIDALGPNATPAQQFVSSTIKNMGFQPTGKFIADYRLHALTPSIGISYRF